MCNRCGSYRRNRRNRRVYSNRFNHCGCFNRFNRYGGFCCNRHRFY